MSTPRERIRDARQRIYNKAKAYGIDIDAERQRQSHTERSLALKTKSLINDQAPTLTRERLVIDDPPLGVMDGANTTYTLSNTPTGENIAVIHHRTGSNTAIRLERSNANPPPTESFYWNRDNPFLLIVGDPPAAGDALFAIYITVG